MEKSVLWPRSSGDIFLYLCLLALIVFAGSVLGVVWPSVAWLFSGG